MPCGIVRKSTDDDENQFVIQNFYIEIEIIQFSYLHEITKDLLDRYLDQHIKHEIFMAYVWKVSSTTNQILQITLITITATP